MDVATFRKIIKSAIQSEAEARVFYRGVAGKMQDPHLKAMFTRFAAEEKNHEQILKSIYTSQSFGRHFDETRDLKIAESMDEPALSIHMTPADALALAMKKEAAAMQQYTSLAEASTDPEQKQMFLDLAAMERTHKLKMENAFVDIGYPEVW